jgi:hypothetical protein
MKLTRQLVINSVARTSRACPRCHARAGDRCFHLKLGAKVMWDQAVHKSRLR